MIYRVTMSWTRCRMNSVPSRLLVALLLTTGLFDQVGLFRTPRLALATYRSCPAPAPEDADPVDDTTPEDGDERGEESARGEPDFVVPSSPSFHRSLPGPLSLPTGTTLPAARASRLRPGAGHFLATGRELRYWVRSLLC
jgi:hypothetical protein